MGSLLQKVPLLPSPQLCDARRGFLTHVQNKAVEFSFSRAISNFVRKPIKYAHFFPLTRVSQMNSLDLKWFRKKKTVRDWIYHFKLADCLIKPFAVDKRLIAGQENMIFQNSGEKPRAYFDGRISAGRLIFEGNFGLQSGFPLTVKTALNTNITA